MTTEPEYCAECGIILYVGPGQSYTCHPCGEKCCDPCCLTDHKHHCAGSLEAKERRVAKRGKS